VSSEIRELIHEHDEVLEILQTPSEGLTWFSPWTLNQIKEEIEKSWNRGYFEDGKLIGFIFAREQDAGLEITNLGTRAANRRQGVMRKLINELLKMRPREDIWLEVHEMNAPAIKLYESLGFVEIGRRKRYYNDGSSALAMKRQTKA
jgi:[ribosomal protein S18]-alanine N-acetyltransferase